MFAVTIAAPIAAAAPIRGQTLMSGVVFSKQVEFTAHGPVVLNVVSAPRPTGLYSIRAWLSNGAVQGRERLTDMENGISATATVVGVNGDYFDSRWGTPSSLLLRGGLLGSGTKGGRSAAGFDGGGALRVDRMSFDGSWKGTGQFRPLGLNEPPGRSAVTLYTPAWGPATPAESGTVEAILAPFPATTPNVTLTAPVQQVVQGGNQAIPPNGAVLVARGAQVNILTAEAPAGGTVSIRLILTPRWNDVPCSSSGSSNDVVAPAKYARSCAAAACSTGSSGRSGAASSPGWSFWPSNQAPARPREVRASSTLPSGVAIVACAVQAAWMAWVAKLMSAPTVLRTCPPRGYSPT